MPSRVRGQGKGKRPPKDRWKIEQEYATAFSSFLSKFNPNAPPNQCFERTQGSWYFAYNPHDKRTESTRGQLLDPECLYVEKLGEETSAILCEGGGATLEGTDQLYNDLEAEFS